MNVNTATILLARRLTDVSVPAFTVIGGEGA